MGALGRSHPLLSSGLSDPTLLQHVFWLWTVKEAFTKCLGLGLGFDFSRISVDLSALMKDPASIGPSDARADEVPVTVDGVPLRGYEVTLFEVIVPKLGADESYQGVVVRRLYPLSGATKWGVMAHPVSLAFAADEAIPPSRFIVRSPVVFSPSRTHQASAPQSSPNAKVQMWDSQWLVDHAIPVSDEDAE